MPDNKLIFCIHKKVVQLLTTVNFEVTFTSQNAEPNKYFLTIRKFFR